MKSIQTIVPILQTLGLTVATAESCTGGMIASEFVSVNGVSDTFMAGFVTYSNESKMRDLGVEEKTIRSYGPVSFECSRGMAVGARRRAKTNIGLSTTGIAGPNGGSKEQPVGLVYISCAIYDVIVTRKFIFHGSRYQIRWSATKSAFQLLFDCLNHQKELL